MRYFTSFIILAASLAAAAPVPAPLPLPEPQNDRANNGATAIEAAVDIAFATALGQAGVFGQSSGPEFEAAQNQAARAAAQVAADALAANQAQGIQTELELDPPVQAALDEILGNNNGNNNNNGGNNNNNGGNNNNNGGNNNNNGGNNNNGNNNGVSILRPRE
ncbi:hypothetical protein MCOR20_002774 [Pyricularia oryzae]|nr:hypothetical protein MCOR20_002774 [Pyricularia oryzae]